MKNIVTVSPDERKKIAKDYSFVPEGVNMRTKVIEISKLAEDIQEERKNKGESMIIHITPRFPRNNRSTNKGVTNVKDALNNVVYGIMVDVDRFKNIVWARIDLEDGITLNLEDIDDAKRWAVLRMHPSIEGTPFIKNQDPLYKIEDPTVEAQKTRRKIKNIKELFNDVDSMNGKQTVDAMRYLGEHVDESLNFEIAKAKLLELVINKPEFVLDKFSNKQKGFEAKILAALDYGIVQENTEKGFVYNDISLGYNMKEAASFIEKDKTVRNGIITQVEEEDLVSQKVQTEFELLKKDGKDIF